MYIVLIGNYPLDRQESMLRFAGLLQEGLEKYGFECELVQPKMFFNRFRLPFLSKWLGYVDKYIVFPLYLKKRLRALKDKKDVIVHICDHSNAVYLKHLCGFKALLTCHDLLAVKSALGLTKEHATGQLGTLLQKWILKYIRNAAYVVCDSEQTLEDVRLLAAMKQEQSSVIYPGFHYPYKRMDEPKARAIIQGLLPDWPQEPFILHVGSDAWYKNRLGVLALYKYLLDKEQPMKGLRLVFVGAELSAPMEVFANKWGLWQSVYTLKGISNEALAALYSKAQALLMPSFYEGYGWPIIEAMACGCPVVTTQAKPMSELGGDVAFYIPRFEGGGEKSLLSWAQEASVGVKKFINLSTKEKTLLRDGGFERIRTFDTKKTIAQYVDFYRKLV